MKRIIIIPIVVVVLAICAAAFFLLKNNPQGANTNIPGPIPVDGPAQNTPTSPDPTATPTPTPQVASTVDLSGSPSPVVSPSPTPAQEMPSPSPVAVPIATPSPSPVAQQSKKTHEDYEKDPNNYEPTNLIAYRTFEIKCGDGRTIEKTIAVPVLYLRGSVCFRQEQFDHLLAIKKRLDQIAKSNEELRVALNLVGEDVRSELASAVPVEILRPQSSSIPSSGDSPPSTLGNMINVPQGPVAVKTAP